MQYRMKFKKVTKWTKFKDFICKSQNTIINSFKMFGNFCKDNFNSIKQFNNRTNYGLIFNRLGILLLVLIPFFVCLVLCLYSLLWIVVTICSFCGNNWSELLHFMPLKLGSILLNVLIAIISPICLYTVIRSALDSLNQDLNSIKQYLTLCIVPLLCNCIIYGILLYKPAFNWTCTALEWIFKIGIGIFILCIIGKILNRDNGVEYDVIQIVVPKR